MLEKFFISYLEIQKPVVYLLNQNTNNMKNQVTLDATDIFVIDRAKETTKERVNMLINDLEIGMSQMLKNKMVDRRHCERRNLLIAALIDVYNSK